jgi:hypothetical protein
MGVEQFYNGAHSDFFEGFIIFVVAALMFYVSGWLFLKQHLSPVAASTSPRPHSGPPRSATKCGCTGAREGNAERG